MTRPPRRPAARAGRTPVRKRGSAAEGRAPGFAIGTSGPRLVRPEVGLRTAERGKVLRIGHFLARHVLDDLQKVVLVLPRGRRLALHDQDIVEALMVLGAVMRLARADAFHVEAFQRLADLGRIEGPGLLVWRSTRPNSNH